MSTTSGSPTRVGIIGLGLIGGSMLRRLAERPSDHAPVGFDTDAETRAAVERAGFVVARSATEVAECSDLIVVAVPPTQTAATVIAALGAAPMGIVTDVASVKTQVVARVGAELPGELDRFLPSHPLAGAETPGWRSTRSDLLDDTIWAVCPPSSGAPVDLLHRFAGVFDAFDARLIVCDPVEHDLAVARTSHAPHIAAEVIASSLDSGPTRLAAALSGGGFRDTTRIARSDSALWAQILQLNRAAVVGVIDEWVGELAKLRTAVAEDRAGPILDVWRRGEAVLRLVEQLRWATPRWERRYFARPAWGELLALGRDGQPVRRVKLEGDGISAEVAGRGGDAEPADAPLFPPVGISGPRPAAARRGPVARG